MTVELLKLTSVTCQRKYIILHKFDLPGMQTIFRLFGVCTSLVLVNGFLF